MHTIKNCPLRSMAWITANKDNVVIDATNEMIQILGCNPVDQPLDSLWTYHPPFSINISYITVTTHGTARTLSLCQHPQSEGNVLVCSDITELKTMHQQHQDASILRLSMYGTIEAVFPNQEFPLCTSWIGQPVMRYIHSDDVKRFCAGISRATRLSCLVQLNVQLEEGESFEWTLISVEDGKQLLCFIRTPSLSDNMYTTTDTSAYKIISQAQQKFWKVLENGLHWAAYHFAHSLLLLVEILCGKIRYEQELQYLIKKRPEIDLVCHWASYLGISQQTSKAWFDHCVDQTLDWLTQDKHDLIV